MPMMRGARIPFALVLLTLGAAVRPLLVFPIDWPEPFRLVMIEAMACGTPVIGRTCGSVPEILDPDSRSTGWPTTMRRSTGPL
jgi:glycosyltransferase involved in cell wall biosynthesis